MTGFSNQAGVGGAGVEARMNRYLKGSPGFFETIKRKNRDPKFYLTTATAQHAIDCLKEHSAQTPDRPFFQYLAFHAPHFPLHALPDDIAKCVERYKFGWDFIRAKRWKRLQELGIVKGKLSDVESDIGPPYHFPDHLKILGDGEVNRPFTWSVLTPEQKKILAKKMDKMKKYKRRYCRYRM